MKIVESSLRDNDFLNFAFCSLIFKFEKFRPEGLIHEFLVTIRTGRRLFPFRTQKLSPCGRW